MATVKDWLHQGDTQKTAIFIAHRLSTIRDCDLIFILHEGKLAEQGTHDELLKKKGLYFQMLESQNS